MLAKKCAICGRYEIELKRCVVCKIKNRDAEVII